MGGFWAREGRKLAPEVLLPIGKKSIFQLRTDRAELTKCIQLLYWVEPMHHSQSWFVSTAPPPCPPRLAAATARQRWSAWARAAAIPPASILPASHAAASSARRHLDAYAARPASPFPTLDTAGAASQQMVTACMSPAKCGAAVPPCTSHNAPACLCTVHTDRERDRHSARKREKEREKEREREREREGEGER